MISRIVVFAVLTAIAARAQTGHRAPPNKGPIFRHTVEPIVIRDGSVKVDIYSTSDTAVVVEKPDTVITNGDGANEGRFLVPTRVLRVRTGPKTVIGKLQTSSALAHKTMSVRRYVYQVEKLEGRKFVPYSELVFDFVKSTWRISPKGASPLNLIGCGEPVALTGAWANHFQSTCEYGYGDLHLRLGSVTIEPATRGPTTTINLGTGCSEFRIEPVTHPPHRTPFDHPPCAGLRLDPTLSYPKVRVKGVNSITAIDVSLAKVKSVTDPAGPQDTK